MKVRLYSIYDKVAEVFNKPFQEINDQSAIRAFTDSASEQPHIKDYELYMIGELDNYNGEIFSQGCPMKLMSGLDIRKADVEPIKRNKS